MSFRKTQSNVIHGNSAMTEELTVSVELQTNKYTLKCLNYALGTLLFVWVLNYLEVFIVDRQVMLAATLGGAAFLLLPKIILGITGMDQWWAKYLILGSVTTALGVYALTLSYHAILLFALPLLFAAQYQSRRVMFAAYGYVLVVLFVSVVGSFRLGLCDMNMLFLSAFPTGYYADLVTGELKNLTINANPALTVPLFFFVPRAITLLLFVPILTHLVDTSADNAVSMMELIRMGEMDRDTRFYNKSKFDRMLKDYYPEVRQVGVIFWDINNLKSINEKYGHTQGNMVISALASCIADEVMNMRQVFRIGGDIFVMVVEDPRENEIEVIKRSVRERIDQHNASSRIAISVAVGSAAGEGSSIGAVVEAADRSMYMDRGILINSEVPGEYRDTILDDRMFEGMASLADDIYIFMYDLRTRVSRWSGNAVEYFSLPGEYMNREEDDLAPRIHPEDRASYIKEMRRIFSGNGVHLQGEYRAMNNQGEYVWIRCRGSVVYDENRQTRFFSGIILRLDNRTKYDPLTKLLTSYELDKVAFDQNTGTLLLIGLDDFRTVINTYGYAFGDRLLAEFAQRLNTICGSTRTPYRMQGDEFLIHCPGMGEEEIISLFNAIRTLSHGLGQDVDRQVSVRFSGGAVVYPTDGITREQLITNLEHSLEMAKREHRGELVFFKQDIAARHQQISIIKERIARIAKEGFTGFRIDFQPMVRRKDHRIAACEALLRCEEIEQHKIPISEVISFLESSGEIMAVGRWVAQQVFAVARQWQQQYDDLILGFNVSAMQLQDPSFIDWLITLSRDYQVDPRRISIELTESSSIEDYYTTALYLKRLRDFGFRIVLDDFGIAYSTLLLIKTLPTDCVKIDHSFVVNLRKEADSKDLAIVESVIDLCVKLGISVVAEGIETEEILEIMEQYPIHYYQGYYFSRPLRQKDFEKLLKNEEEKAS